MNILHFSSIFDSERGLFRGIVKSMLLLLLMPHNKSGPVHKIWLPSIGSSGHINFSLCLCIFIIMDFIAVNNSWDK